jgi:hypothetical protein
MITTAVIKGRLPRKLASTARAPPLQSKASNKVDLWYVGS